MATVAATLVDQLIDGLGDVSIQDQVCAICLDKIRLEETAVIRGCEHAYCVTCILQWATYKEKPTCPQCKHPLEFLNIHRSLDGSLHDYMIEESVCLLLRATWFKPLVVDENTHLHDDLEDYIPFEVGQYEAYEDDEYFFYGYNEEEDVDDAYFSSSSGVRIGNRRWGDSGYVRVGRQEARPLNRSLQSAENGASGSSRTPKQKETGTKEKTGRRAKRAQKREAADKAAAAKHQMHLERLGRI